MRDIPTLLLGLPSLRPLYDTLDSHSRADTAAALIAGIASAQGGSTRPVLRTGRLVPFDPAALERRIRDALSPDRLSAHTVLPILHRYLRQR